MATQTVKIRCSELLLRRLDGLAEAHGGNRSQAIRSAVLAASLPEGTPPVPDHNELMRLLGELARMGSLPAIRLLLAEQRRRPAEADPFAEFEPNPLERLAARRPDEGFGMTWATHRAVFFARDWRHVRRPGGSQCQRTKGMADYSQVRASLERLEEEQRDRYRPTPEEPRTPIEAYAKALDAARTRPAVSIAAGWLR